MLRQKIKEKKQLGDGGGIEPHRHVDITVVHA